MWSFPALDEAGRLALAGIKKCLLVLLLGIGTFAHAEPGKETQRVVDRLYRLVARHPSTVLGNLQFQRDPVEFLHLAETLSEQLKNPASTLDFSSQNTLRIFGYEGQDSVPNAEAIKHFKEEVLKNRDKVSSALGGLSDFRSDLNTILGTPKLIPAFLLVAPFLYHPETGATLPVGNLDQVLDALSPNAIASLYQDTLPEHLLTQVDSHLGTKESDIFDKGHQIFKSSFLAKEVYNASTYVTETGAQLRRSTLSLEEVPPIVALFRGAFGKDCSLKSVPFHVLLSQAVKVFLIRGSDQASSEPAGYAFVVQVEHQGVKVPQVITINGNLNAEATQATLQVIARAYNSKQILLPDFDRTTAPLINTPTIKQAMRLPGGVPTEVKMPEGWEVVDRFTVENQDRAGYHNYYQREGLQHALLSQIDWPEETHYREGVVPDPYPTPDPLSQAQPLARSLFAAMFYWQQMPKDREAILNQLNVTDAQVQAVRFLAHSNPTYPLSRDEILNARNLFKFTPAQLLELDPLAAASYASRIFQFQTHPEEFFTAAEWAKLGNQISKKLERVLTNPLLVLENRISRVANAQYELASLFSDPNHPLRQAMVSAPAWVLLAAGARHGNHALIREGLRDPKLHPNDWKGPGPSITADWRKNQFNSALNTAISMHHESSVRLLLDGSAGVHFGLEDGLYTAINSGSEPMVRLFLDRGANFRVGNEHALQLAVAKGNEPVVRLLLDRGADAKVLGSASLMNALNHEPIFHLLLERGADIHVDSDSAVQMVLQNDRPASLVRLIVGRALTDRPHLLFKNVDLFYFQPEWKKLIASTANSLDPLPEATLRVLLREARGRGGSHSALLARMILAQPNVMAAVHSLPPSPGPLRRACGWAMGLLWGG